MENEITRGMELPKKYKKEFSHSYTLGPFPTFELLQNRPGAARAVYYSESFREKEKLQALCGGQGVPCLLWERALERISNKEACYAAGMFEKYGQALDGEAPHVALVNPSDMGNLGTILRTLLGFGIRDLAIVEPAADIWNPKVVRASMGALFHMRFQFFEDFEGYLREFGGNRDIFPFMLDGGTVLTPASCPQSSRYTLVFGNEASGLPPEFQTYGKSLFISQTPEVDSLNLAVSVAIGAYLFARQNAEPLKGGI